MPFPVLLLFILTGSPALSQDDAVNDPDSLINRVYELYDEGHYLEAIVISEQIMQAETAKTVVDTLLLARAIGSIALSYRDLGYYYEAILYFEKMLDLSVARGDSSWIAAAHSNRGEVLRSLGRFEESLLSFNEALMIDRALNDTVGVSIDLGNIGKVYQIWGQPENSFPFYMESLEIIRATGNEEREAMMMASIGMAYHDMNRYDDALSWLDQALELDKTIGNQNRIGSRYDQIGGVLMKEGKYGEANRYFLRALEIFRNNEMANSEAITLNHMANNYYLQGDPETAADYFNQSLALSGKTGNKSIQQKGHQELAALYEETGAVAMALFHTKSYIALRDTLFTESAQRQLTEFRTRFESEKKEREITLLNEETLRQQLEISRTKQQRTLTGIFGMMLVIALGFVFYRYRTKQKHNRILSELNTELNELNATKTKLFTIIAHDLKNPTFALSAISESLNANLDNLSKENLKYYLSELSLSANSVKHLLKNLLDWARTQQDAIKVCYQELDLSRVAAESAEPVLADIHRKQIVFHSGIPENFTLVSDRYILQTVLRNLLTNAAKFTQEGGRIEVTATQDRGNTEIRIVDNGCGMTAEEVANLFKVDRKPLRSGTCIGQGPGLGLIICRELLDKVGGSIMVKSKSGEGTTFQVSLPVVG